MLDILIINGAVYDGSAKPPQKTNIGIKDNKIYLLKNSAPSSKKIINAENKCVAPGFIDIHSHSDETYLLNPKAESKIRQGITTEVTGNCGTSPFPILRDYFSDFKKSVKTEYSSDIINWQTAEEFFDIIKKNKLGINAAFLTGHGNLRRSLNFDTPGKLTKSDLAKLVKLLEESLSSGSYGLSTGLAYFPSGFANTQEIVELAKTVKKYDGLYSTHIRNEQDKVIESVDEAILTGLLSGAKTQISHHKAGLKENWGKVNITLDNIERARKKGVFVHCDQYPYTACSTSLDIILPKKYSMTHRQALLKLLSNKDNFNKIARQLDEHHKGDFDNVLISSVINIKDRQFVGKFLPDIAKEINITSSQSVLKLLLSNQCYVSAIFFTMCEKDIETVMSAPFTAICSDSTARAPYGILSKNKPHPRSYGAFAKVLSHYSIKKKVIDICEAIRKMTSLPAYIMGFKNRGLIAEGYKADIVIFDKNKIKDTATYENPHSYAEGIEYVILNGKTVINKGKHTGILSGEILRK